MSDETAFDRTRPNPGPTMKFTTSSWSTILEPGGIVVLWALINGLNALFKVQSTLGAVLVGFGIAALIMPALYMLTVRFRKYGVGPVLNPWYLPWGVLLGIAGGVMLMLGPPWKYNGFGLLVVIAPIYLLVGTWSLLRESDLLTREPPVPEALPDTTDLSSDLAPSATRKPITTRKAQS